MLQTTETIFSSTKESWRWVSCSKTQAQQWRLCESCLACMSDWLIAIFFYFELLISPDSSSGDKDKPPYEKTAAIKGCTNTFEGFWLTLCCSFTQTEKWVNIKSIFHLEQLIDAAETHIFSNLCQSPNDPHGSDNTGDWGKVKSWNRKKGQELQNLKRQT